VSYRLQTFSGFKFSETIRWGQRLKDSPGPATNFIIKYPENI
jgi:hypothetical protein